MIDLKSASRDELIRLIVSQHETIARQEGVIAAQQGRIAALEALASAQLCCIIPLIFNIVSLYKPP